MTWPYLPPLPYLACDLFACHWIGLTAAQIVSYFSNSIDKTQGSSSTWAGLVSLLYMYFLVCIHLIYKFICWAYAYTGLITVSTIKKGNTTHLVDLQPSVKLELTQKRFLYSSNNCKHWYVAPIALTVSATFVRVLDHWCNDCLMSVLVDGYSDECSLLYLGLGTLGLGLA